MAAWLDGVRFNPTLGGTTDWTYSSFVVGYQSPAAANVVNGRIYKYRAEAADLSQWEFGEGAYNTSTGVLARTTVLYSYTGGVLGTSKVSFSAVPQVAIVALKEDMISVEEANSFTATQQGQARGNLGATAFGFVNRLRNSSLTAWFHGSSSLTITTAGAWGAEGLYIVPTGASVTAVQIANGLSGPLTFWAQKITGAASVTDVVVRFVVESYDAAALAGQQVTFQVPVLNNTGASITPTVTVKRANAQDATYTNVDVSAVALQTIANGATGVLSYCWAANALSFNGLSIDIDFGNNFSTTGKSIQIGGGFDLRVTPGIVTGAVANPAPPEIRDAASDTLWNKRFYTASYVNGTAPGTATTAGMVSIGWNDGVNGGSPVSIQFITPQRATPSVINYYDSAGTASSVSTVPASSSTFTAGTTTTPAPYNASANGFTITGPNAVAHVEGFIHYTSDATLVGG